MLKKMILVSALLAMLLPAFSGCSEEGPMEKAGKKMDQAAEDASDAADEAAKEAKKLFE